MTNLEAAQQALSFNIGVDQASLEKALIDFGLDPAAEYVAANKCAVNAAAATVLGGSMMLKSISEGGYSVSFDIDGMKGWLANLAKNSCGLYVVPPELKLPGRKVRARFMH